MVIKKSFDLDDKKNWLLLFGHSQVNIKLDDKLQEQSNTIRYSYIDGKLTPITLEEFKKLNKGSKW